ncbi:MAG: hypothetical protein ACYCQJ_01430 [Nitrososphaerales archaeon]
MSRLRSSIERAHHTITKGSIWAFFRITARFHQKTWTFTGQTYYVGNDTMSAMLANACITNPIVGQGVQVAYWSVSGNIVYGTIL